MELKKAPQQLIDTFDAVMPGPPAEKRKMFGYPSGFVNGNMFMGLFADQMILRFPEESPSELIELGGEPFEPMGRPMREYVTVPASLLANKVKLSAWVKKSLEYGSSLPTKKKKAAGAKSSGKRQR